MKKGETKIPLKKVLAAITECRGMVYLAAQKLGVNPRTIYNYRDSKPEVREAIQTARGQFVDTCELALEEAVLRGEGWAVCFTLKTLGKDRGYVEKHEIAGADGQPIKVIVEHVRQSTTQDD
jgi:hypothetical protein